MKTLLTVCVLLGLVSSGADAAPPDAYIGVFGDQDHSITSVSPGLYTPFNVWIWVLPSARGFMATEFRVTLPSNVVTTATVQNPDMVIIMDCSLWDDTICAVFNSCQADWVWTHHLTCMALSLVPGFIEISPPSYATALQAANCEPGYPMETVTVLDKFGIRQDGVVAVEARTWGAIKSLYR